jgi:hypothetical protein
MKLFFIFMFVLSCQKQEAVNPAVPASSSSDAAVMDSSGAVVKEEDCDEKAKQVQKVEITEETIKLGGSPDAGCTLE